MDADVKKQLDLRLASGEISREEYAATLQALNGEADGRSPLVSAFGQMKEAIWGEYRMVSPSDDAPLVVNDSLRLYGEFLVYGSRRVSFSEINALYYRGEETQTNGSSTFSNELVIHVDKGERIQVTASSAFFSIGNLAHKKFHLLQNAYLVLRKATFQRRFGLYLRSFATLGYVMCGNAKVYRNGDVEEDGVRINLKTACEENRLEMGAKGFLWKDPNLVILTEASGGILPRKIRMYLNFNADVERIIIDELVKRGSI